MGELEASLSQIHHHSMLLNADVAARYLADCIAADRRLLVVADYDCDGATACAVAVRGLRALGANVGFIVPDRMVHGYGLTPSVVELAASKEEGLDPEVLITVDNGVASHQGVERAIELGLEVLVTDHHLPVKNKPLPRAITVVDPAQPNCPFPSKSLAGCGVIWYVLWALQDELKRRGVVVRNGFKVSSLLPLVAVGTVADVVALDKNNRALVQVGLEKIRSGQSFDGIDALISVGPANQAKPENIVTSDIAFGVGPRINAAGRLASMSIGIQCLLTNDPSVAQELAEALDEINRVRREVEYKTADEAFRQALALVKVGTWTIAVESPGWHPGVIGIVAGRIKEQKYLPTFVLATDEATGKIKGSGRSIPGLNLKDCLDQVDKAAPGLMEKFGGHAMAAGLTLRPGGFEEFRDAFEEQARLMLSPEILQQKVEVDGSLSGMELSAKTAKALRMAPWGQGFLEPAFFDEFFVRSAKVTGVFKDQLNMELYREGVQVQATKFRHQGLAPAVGSCIKAVYKLQLSHDKFGNDVLKLLVDQII